MFVVCIHIPAVALRFFFFIMMINTVTVTVMMPVAKIAPVVLPAIHAPPQPNSIIIM